MTADCARRHKQGAPSHELDTCEPHQLHGVCCDARVQRAVRVVQHKGVGLGWQDQGGGGEEQLEELKRSVQDALSESGL